MAKLTKRQIRLNQVQSCLGSILAFQLSVVDCVSHSDHESAGTTFVFTTTKLLNPNSYGSLQIFFEDQSVDYISGALCSFVLSSDFLHYMSTLTVDPLLDVTTITL